MWQEAPPRWGGGGCSNFRLTPPVGTPAQDIEAH